MKRLDTDLIITGCGPLQKEDTVYQNTQRSHIREDLGGHFPEL